MKNRISKRHFYFTAGLLLLFFFMVSSCGAQKSNSETQLLVGCWTHSYEEDTGEGEMVMRPCDFKEYPPSRFRFQFILNTDGTCSWLALAPNDAHQMQNGTWKFDSEKQILRLLNTQNEQVLRYKLVMATTSSLSLIQM